MKTLPAFPSGSFFRAFQPIFRGALVAAGLVIVGAPFSSPAATWYDWKDDAPDGNWTQGAAGARWWPGDLWDLPSPNNVLKFNNNHYTSSTNNASGYSVNGLVFGDSATGPHTISGNTLSFAKDGGINPFIQNEAGGTLQTIALDIVGASDGALEFKMGGDMRLTGTIQNNAWIDVWWAAGKTLTLEGAISGSGGLTLKENSTVILSGGNTYNGDTWVDAGVLRAAHNNALGSTSGITTVTDGATLQLSNGITTAENLVIRGSGVGDAGALQSVSGNNTVTGSISIDGFAPGVTRVGAASGASLNLGDVTASSGKEFWIVGEGNTTVTGQISADAPFVKFGSGTATLSGNNALSANKYLREGTVVLSNNNAFGSSGTTELGWLDGVHSEQMAELRIGNGVNHGGKVVAGYISNGLTVTLSVAGSSSAEMSGTLDLAHNLTAHAGSGAALTISGAATNTGGLIKAGAGTVTISGATANSFGGVTAVEGGTLELAKDDAGMLALSGSAVSVAGGAKLLISQSEQINDTATITLSGGTILRGDGVSETAGDLSITSASTVDFGGLAENSFLKFGTITGGSDLTIANFKLDNKFQFAALDFAAGQSIADTFTFAGSDNFTYSFGSGTFTITAIPEPSAYAAAGGLLGLMLWPARRRIVRDTKRILGLRVPMRDRLARRGA